MKYYKLRVDLVNTTCSEIQNLLSLYSSQFAYVIEMPEENPHIHAYLEMEATAQNLRLKLRKLGITGNGGYSLKECDERHPIEYFAYMMKEGHPVFNGIPKDIIERAQQYNQKVQEEMKEKKASRRTQLDILRDAWHQYEKEIEVKLNRKPSFRKEDIVKFVCEYYKTEKKLVREFQIVSLCQSLALEFIPGYCNELQSRILDKM